MRIHASDIHVVRVLAELSEVHGFVRSPLLQCVFSNLHVGDAGWCEHGLLHVVFIRLPADFLNHAPQHAIAEIRIGPVLSRWIAQREVLQRPRDQLRLVPRLKAKQRIGGVVGPASARVRQQVIDRDIGDVLLARGFP
jgi:hypothetical protein